MYYKKPDYYNDFTCIASACPDTCCKGWKIEIDKKTLKKYKEAKGSFGTRLRNSIDFPEREYKRNNGKCIFLNENQLCELYIQKGESMVCETCRTYPRHVENYGKHKEFNILLSCPEVARIIASKTDKTRIIRCEKPKLNVKSYKIDEKLFYVLEQARDLAFLLVQDRSKPVYMRMSVLLVMARDFQKRIKTGKYEMAMELLERYHQPKRLLFVANKLNKVSRKGRFYSSKAIINSLDHLEMIPNDFQKSYHMLRFFYQEMTESRYRYLYEEYEKFRKREFKDYYIEQLMVYFIYGNACSAVYDKDFYNKIVFCLVSIIVIEEFNFCQWVFQEYKLSFTEVIHNIYNYAREIEHCDNNFDIMEKMFQEEECFSMEQLCECMIYV